ncbi:pentatricopeptide repeat-containing protein [Cucumis melo var. makuwa]|uniref:Pentatricopeptide repeat-containing protein n=2 Tax=Cucumis melo TaxID=3656 RepID=A0A5D3DX68_CUCMM|nr:pentatricopeptide repeat-containing protein [Cucumis melo var. makuwa]
MGGAGCVPVLASYGTLIHAATAVRRTDKAVKLLKEMVVKVKLTERLFTLWLRYEQTESYELLVEGCLECREYILARKVTMGIIDKGFIPYIKVRQKVVEGLADIGKWNLLMP